MQDVSFAGAFDQTNFICSLIINIFFEFEAGRKLSHIETLIRWKSLTYFTFKVLAVETD
jgi:hypothetical protein